MTSAEPMFVGPRPGLSRRQALLLAALLEADGSVVPYAQLGDLVGTSGVDDNDALRSYAHRLHALGVDCVQVVPRRGLRLTDVPPDWTLETVLWALDTLRRSEEPPVLTWRRAS